MYQAVVEVQRLVYMVRLEYIGSRTDMSRHTRRLLNFPRRLPCVYLFSLPRNTYAIRFVETEQFRRNAVGIQLTFASKLATCISLYTARNEVGKLQLFE